METKLAVSISRHTTADIILQIRTYFEIEWLFININILSVFLSICFL